MENTTSKTATQTTIPDEISAIAAIIRGGWKKVYFGAVPYLEAMQGLTHICQTYGSDSAESIVRYFLANATAWRGETARAVKAKLNQLLKNGLHRFPATS